MSLPFTEAIEWYVAKRTDTKRTQQSLCTTRDVFQARLDTFYREMIARKLLIEDEAALLAAICGELGNNCFDHNLGQWPDVAGCWFSYLDGGGRDPMLVVIADRGQGLFNSLKHVLSDLKTEQEAIRIAFERKISGRSPERRGNGLKFVRSVINGSPKRGLLFYSGKTKTEFGGFSILARWPFEDKIKEKCGTGMMALIVWEKQ